MSLIVGFDPGLASFGMCIAELDENGAHRGARPDDALRIIRLSLFESKPTDKKLKLLASSDWARRGQELSRFIQREIDGGTVGIVVTESLSPVRNAVSSMLMGISFGVILDFVAHLDCTFTCATPQAIKKATGGKISASKTEIEDGVRRFLPSQAAKLDSLVCQIPEGEKRGHPFDALAAILTCWDDEIFKSWRATRRQKNEK
jgi:Holliday junction resolvasome RuvABC endonuclease subunit